jgi:hypothetical protein
VAARGGRTLLSVQTVTGKLFRINPRTGVAREVDLGGATLANGDGMLLAGHLYAVNARFGTTDPQPARYDIVRVGRQRATAGSVGIGGGPAGFFRR